MELNLKITTSFLLLIQAFHLALLQNSTDSPGRTIDKTWFRDRVENTNISQNENSINDDRTGSGIDDSSGTTSGFTVQLYEDDYVSSNHEDEMTELSDDATVSSFTTLPTNYTAELTSATTSSSASPTNSSETNATETGNHFYKSTTSAKPTAVEMTTQISTGIPELSNHTDLGTMNDTTDSNDIQESTKEPDTVTGLAHRTESKTTVSTTADKQGKETSSSTTPFSNEKTQTIPVTTIAAAASTAKDANLTDKDGASGGNSERGFASDVETGRRHRAWGAVLGTAVAMIFVGLVVYVILKKKTRKGFSHRKLIEEFPTDPVLRLDNSEPLNLNYGGSAYYNPGLQGDNIQMTDFPHRYTN